MLTAPCMRLPAYGDPPNSDLLRRYGYVDLFNGADEVEITCRHLYEAGSRGPDIQEHSMYVESRIDYITELRAPSFYLSYAFHPSNERPHRPQPEDPTEDDVKNALDDSPYEDELLEIARGLGMDEHDFDMLVSGESMPKAKLNLGAAQLLLQAIAVCLEGYEGGADSSEDEERIYGSKAKKLSANERNAIVVRLGEKRVLESHKALLSKYVEMEKRRLAAKEERDKQRPKKRTSQTSLNKGYGGEAISWALDWAFRFGGYHRVAIGLLPSHGRLQQRASAQHAIGGRS